MHKKTFVIFTTLLSINLLGQNSSTGNWFFYNGYNALKKNLFLHNEIQHRNYNFVGDLQQLLIRTGIGTDLSKHNNNILFGYAFIKTSNYATGNEGKTSFNEHRLFQQFITKQNFGRYFLSHRYRMEERWIAESFKLRFRYLFGINVPLNSGTMTEGTIYLSLYNEIFINTISPAFERDRVYAGLGYSLNKKLRIELGYLSQILEGNQRGQSVITLINNLPFYHENEVNH